MATDDERLRAVRAARRRHQAQRSDHHETHEPPRTPGRQTLTQALPSLEPAASVERSPAAAQHRTQEDDDRFVSVLAGGASSRMATDVDFIVELLKGQWLSKSDQAAIVGRIEPYLRADVQLQDLTPGATDYLDHVLSMLKARTYQRTTLGTLFQAQHAIVFDDLWRRLDGTALSRFRDIVAASRQQAGGPGQPTYDSAFATVVSPVFWAAASMLSFGVVEPALFDEMFAAKGSVEQLGVIVQHTGRAAIDFLTFGTARAAYHGAIAYAEKHPDCSMTEIRAAGLLAAAEAVLPLRELQILAKALGIVDTAAGEVPPELGQAAQAFFQGALKVIVVGAIIHAKVKASSQAGETASPEQVRTQLAGTRGRAPAPRLAMPAWRAQILRRVRRVTDNPDIVFWEQIPLGTLYEGVRAGPVAAEALRVPRGSIIGYVPKSAKTYRSAIADMEAVQTTAPPYPDPFSASSLNQAGSASPASSP